MQKGFNIRKIAACPLTNNPHHVVRIAKIIYITMSDQEKTEFKAADIFVNFVDSLKTVALSPAKFFEDMPPSERYRNPALFLLICHFAAGIFSFLTGGGIVDIIGFPVFGIISAIIVSLIIDYLRKEVFDTAGSYEKSFQIISYSSCVILISFLPWIGFLAALYGLYLVVTGIQAVYSMTTGKAVITVILTLLGMNLLRFIFPWIVSISQFGLFS
jgi:hypothetical protein